MTTIRKLLIVAITALAALAVAAPALPAGATPKANDNWHVHDGGASDSELKSFGVALFPALYGQEGDVYEPATDPVVCPDATDKGGMLPNGNHTNRHVINGVCHTDEYVIHLRTAAGGGEPTPKGWSSIPFGPHTVFYRLTPR
jgi:hypothetical protein